MGAPDCPVTLFVRGLKKTKALRGVDFLLGAPGLARTTSPGRIILYPANGEFVQPSDVSVSLFDVQQQCIAEIWVKGSSSGAADEATLADWNEAYALMTRFLQALAEQGEAPATPDAPGPFWEVIDGPAWETSSDTGKQGTAIKLLCAARCPIPAAADDQGHVGDNWPQGQASSVDISGAP